MMIYFKLFISQFTNKIALNLFNHKIGSCYSVGLEQINTKRFNVIVKTIVILNLFQGPGREKWLCKSGALK
ncbi:hypothetical protein N824_09125 [Pedobacter sp. V48]|nr:hypothetical protein N824_09125 [Pedobacter sp. V48]